MEFSDPANNTQMKKAMEGLHLAYLGVIPALATFAIASTVGHKSLIFVFLGGIVLISVYLAFIISYTQISNSILIALLTILDGPIFAVLAQSGAHNKASFLKDSFIVDGVAIWLAIIWLAITTSRPSTGQKIGTAVLGVIALAALAIIFRSYYSATIMGNWGRTLWLTFGIGEAIAARYYLLEIDEVKRGERITGPYIAIFLVIWIAALVAGGAIHGNA